MSLAIYLVRTISCDAPGCHEEREDAAPAAEVRADCRSVGWRCDRSGDWCPIHERIGGGA